MVRVGFQEMLTPSPFQTVGTFYGDTESILLGAGQGVALNNYICSSYPIVAGSIGNTGCGGALGGGCSRSKDYVIRLCGFELLHARNMFLKWYIAQLSPS